MFSGFARVWTPVELSSIVHRAPVKVTVAGEQIVLFRDHQGRLGALIDQCPHRGVALSLGKVTARGCIECPFHGWEFTRDGDCTKVPLNSLDPARRRRYAATALPVQEHGGLVWIYTAPTDDGVPVPEPHVPAALTDPAFTHYRFAKDWACHWTRAMENMLDFPHLPWVHRRTIGRGMRRDLTDESIMKTWFEPTPFGAVIRAEIDQHTTGASLDWGRPNGMVLNVSMPGRKVFQHVWCVPIDERHTRMIVLSARNFGHYNPLAWLFDRFNHIIVGEDQAVVESSQPSEVPPPADEHSVATDGPTLMFRKYYLSVLKGSDTDRVPDGVLSPDETSDTSGTN